MAPRLARLLALFAAVFAFAALGWVRPAAAEAEETSAALGPARRGGASSSPRRRSSRRRRRTSSASRTAGSSLEFPASVRDRVIGPRAATPQEFRARLAADLGQPVLDHVLVRVARNPSRWPSWPRRARRRSATRPAWRTRRSTSSSSRMLAPGTLGGRRPRRDAPSRAHARGARRGRRRAPHPALVRRGPRHPRVGRALGQALPGAVGRDGEPAPPAPRGPRSGLSRRTAPR